MKRAAVFPYLRPIPERVQTEPWEIRRPDGEFAAVEGDEVPDWDYSTRLAFRRTAVLDVEGIARDCGLGAGAMVRVSPTWKSTRTGLQGAGAGQSIALGHGEVEVQVTLDLPGRDLGGTLILGLCLTLVNSGPGPARLAPTQPGSRLWEDHARYQLEGTASRFPLEVVEFGSHYALPEGGVWYLEWSPEDLSQPVLGSLRLLINSQRANVVAALSGDKQDPTNAAIRSAIHSAVAERLILGALGNDEFVADPSQYDEGSVGHAIHGLIQAAFGMTIESLASRALSQPGHFRCQIQERMGLFAELEA